MISILGIEFSGIASWSVTASSSSTFPEYVIDGRTAAESPNLLNCFSTQSEDTAWLKIDLDSVYTVDSVVVYLALHEDMTPANQDAKKASLVSVVVQAGLELEDQTLCGRVEAPPKSNPLVVACGSGVQARHLTLERTQPGALELCEIAIVGEKRFISE